MRIIYISHLFLPAHSGGTELYTYYLAKEAQRRGHQVQVVCCGDFKSSRPQVILSRDEPHESLPVRRLFLETFFSPNSARDQYYNPLVEADLLEFYRRWRPDVIHAIHLGYLTTAAATAARRAGVPFLFTATDFWMICPTSQLLRYDGSTCDGPSNLAKCLKCYAVSYQRARRFRWLLGMLPEGIVHRALQRLPDRELFRRFRLHRSLVAVRDRAEWNRHVAEGFAWLIAPSCAMQRYLSANGLPQDKIRLLPFGIPEEWLRPEKRNFSLPLRFAFIGTVARHKGLHVLLDAFRNLPPDLPAQLSIYGDLDFDPRYKPEVLRRLEELPRARVEGSFHHSRLPEILRQRDVLVVPSLWYENTPLVLYAALGTRTPVICTDLEGMTELVQNGVNGLTFPRGDSGALAERIRRCCGDPELLRTFSARIQLPRTIRELAGDLFKLYRESAELAPV